MTSPHVVDEFILHSDIQSIVEFKRREEDKVNDFYQATLPYMYVDNAALMNHNYRDNNKKRNVRFPED
jgi:hypothetical protein